jgi:tripartite-type tricarboxylate transporter receptor subunit TctC
MKTTIAVMEFVVSLALAASAFSAQYPAKPIHLIVPFAAGGASDTAARTLGQALTKSIGQPIVIENKPGANGAVAAQALAAAPPDGYTLLWAVGSMEALPLLMKTPPYESLADFTPISMVGRITFALFTHPSIPAKSVAELAAYARANPDKLSYAASTVSEHMAAAQFMKASGSSMVRVPYKGGAQAMPDLVAGRVQVYFTPISIGLPHARDNRLRLLATLLPQRSAAVSDIQTMTEAGFEGVSVPTWQAFFGPPKMPPEIANRIAGEISLVLKDPTVRAQLEQQTLQIDGSTPETLATTVRREHRIWAQFVRDNGVMPD